MSRYGHSLWNALTARNPLPNCFHDFIIFARLQERSEITHVVLYDSNKIDKAEPKSKSIQHGSEIDVICLRKFEITLSEVRRKVHAAK
jgi:hypothetical protein